MSSTTRLIRIGFEHDPNSVKKIPQHRLSRKLINNIFRCNVDHFKDQFGAVLWPHEWARKCQIPPYMYFIVEKTEKHTIEDSEFDIRYIGDTDVFVINVPSEVKQKELHAWFRAGMISGDPLMQEMKEELNKAQDQLRRLILMEEKIVKDEVAAEEALRKEKARLLEEEAAQSAAPQLVTLVGVDIPKTEESQQQEEGLLDIQREEGTGTIGIQRVDVEADIRASDPRVKKLQRLRWKLAKGRIPELKAKMERRRYRTEQYHVRFEYVCMQGSGKHGDHLVHGMGDHPALNVKDEFMKDVRTDIERFHIWAVHIDNDEEGDVAMHLLEYPDWNNIRLYRGVNGRPPSAIYKGVEDEDRSNELQAIGNDDETTAGEHTTAEHSGDHEINMRGAAIVRLRHGRGASRSSDTLNVHCGGYHLSRKHGRGVEIGADGVYIGQFRENVRFGFGRLQYSRGDVYDGVFGTGEKPRPTANQLYLQDKDENVSDDESSTDGTNKGIQMPTGNYANDKVTADEWGRMSTAQKAQLLLHPGITQDTRIRQGVIRSEDDLFGNMYRQGVPHGVGTIRFADGATYVGQMRRGRICGVGRYEHPNGEVQEGTFKDGVLHGEGMKVLPNGVVHRGVFQHGELQGFACELRHDGTVYEGYMKRNERNGYGKLVADDERLVYDGHWRDNLFHHHGSLRYLGAENLAGYVVEGRFNCGQVREHAAAHIRPGVTWSSHLKREDQKLLKEAKQIIAKLNPADSVASRDDRYQQKSDYDSKTAATAMYSKNSDESASAALLHAELRLNFQAAPSPRLNTVPMSPRRDIKAFQTQRTTTSKLKLLKQRQYVPHSAKSLLTELSHDIANAEEQVTAHRLRRDVLPMYSQSAAYEMLGRELQQQSANSAASPAEEEKDYLKKGPISEAVYGELASQGISLQTIQDAKPYARYTMRWGFTVEDGRDEPSDLWNRFKRVSKEDIAFARLTAEHHVQDLRATSTVNSMRHLQNWKKARKLWKRQRDMWHADSGELASDEREEAAADQIDA